LWCGGGGVVSLRLTILRAGVCRPETEAWHGAAAEHQGIETVGVGETNGKTCGGCEGDATQVPVQGRMSQSSDE